MLGHHHSHHSHNIQAQQHLLHPHHGHHGHGTSFHGKKVRKLAGLCANPKWRSRLYVGGFILTCTSIMISLHSVILRFMPSPSCTNVYFSPHSSIAFDISGMYCDKLTVKKYLDNSPASYWNTSLYLLHQMPNLSTVYDFTLSENITLPASGFYKLSFYLHQGSSYTIKTCKLNSRESNDVQVCVVRGDNNLNDWIKTRFCKQLHSIKSCNSSSWVNFTYSEVINVTDTYYFVYSTQNEIEASLLVDMAFINLEYSVEQNNVYRQCTISGETQSCAIDIPTNFIGTAVLVTSAQTDQPDVWKNSLPVSWECDPSFGSFEIHMFLPSAVPEFLYIIFFLSSVCIAVYCHGRRTIWLERMWLVLIIVSTIVAIPISLAFNILWAQRVAVGFSWSCDPEDAKQPLYFSVPFQAVISLTILVSFMFVFYSMLKRQSERVGNQNESTRRGQQTTDNLEQQQSGDQNVSIRQEGNQNIDNLEQQQTGNQNASIRQEGHQRDSRKLSRTIFMIKVMSIMFFSAAFCTFLEAILPIMSIYSEQVNIFTPGDTHIFTVKNYFISSLSMDYIGSPYLTATLYVSDEQPQLKHTTYGTSETLVCNQIECERIWQSYLNQQSSVNINVCLNESELFNGANATFYIIKGVNSDTSDDSQIHVSPGSLQKLVILNECNKCFERKLFIEDQNVDRYFFILKGYNHSIIDVNLQFNRTDYFPEYINASKVTSCTIGSHSIDSCTSSLSNKIFGSSTALIVVTSDLDKPFFEWQETMCITLSSNYRASTWTSLWLPVFVFNMIVFSVLCPLWMLLHHKAATSRPAVVPQTFNSGSHSPTSERTPLLQSDSLDQNIAADPNNNTNEDNNSPKENDVPVIETNESLNSDVSRNLINPGATADTDNEHSNNESDHNPSSVPVEAPQNTNMDSEVDAVQRDELEGPAVHSDREESRPDE